MQTLGEKIAAVRKRRKITQTELSKTTGIPQATISRIEGGKTFNPGAGIITRICNGLDVDPKYLLIDREPPAKRKTSNQWNVSTVEEVCEKLGPIFNTTQVGMSVVELDGTHYCVNDALCKLWGRSREELQGLTVHETTLPADLNVNLNFIEAALAGEMDSAQLKKRHFHRNGDVISVVVTSSLIRGINNKPICFISWIREAKP